MSASYTIARTAAGWRVTWHRHGNEVSIHPTLHDAEFAVERIYGSPLAHLKALAA